jgi:60 kDa SS-A/Ro ribonucleoprotein
MPNVIHRTLNPRVPQNVQADPAQVLNNAGGWVYDIGVDAAFERFLVLGTEGGSYYASERQMTQTGIALVRTALTELPVERYFELVVRAAQTSPKRSYALWALAEALVSGSPAHRSRVAGVVPEVCFTGTDVFELASYVRGRRGWGPTVRRAFDSILLGLPPEKLALWMVKYRDRFGFTWRDLLRLNHPSNDDAMRNAIFDFATGRAFDQHQTPAVIVGHHLNANEALTESQVLSLIETHGLPWEALRDEQRTPAVWRAVTPNIGNQAVLRNLATFTRNGLAADAEFRRTVADRIARATNLHPIKILDALKTYRAGGGLGRSRGGEFTPHVGWLTALEDALERSFTDGVVSTGRRVYVGLDVSGSMGSNVSGSFVLTCREVGAALALAFVRNEEECEVRGFTAAPGQRYVHRGGAELTHLAFSRRTDFASAMKITEHLDFGGTDCALPMLDAKARRVRVDTFVIITDNETWAGQVHPMQALRDYRADSGINAQLVVIGLTATNFSIADPRDRATMDFIGFSSDLPLVVQRFMSQS